MRKFGYSIENITTSESCGYDVLLKIYTNDKVINNDVIFEKVYGFDSLSDTFVVEDIAKNILKIINGED